MCRYSKSTSWNQEAQAKLSFERKRPTREILGKLRFGVFNRILALFQMILVPQRVKHACIPIALLFKKFLDKNPVRNHLMSLFDKEYAFLRKNKQILSSSRQFLPLDSHFSTLFTRLGFTRKASFSTFFWSSKMCRYSKSTSWNQESQAKLSFEGKRPMGEILGQLRFGVFNRILALFQMIWSHRGSNIRPYPVQCSLRSFKTKTRFGTT